MKPGDRFHGSKGVFLQPSANGMVQPCSGPAQQGKLARGTKDEEHAMSHKLAE
jgi:hypothetical protein